MIGHFRRNYTYRAKASVANVGKIPETGLNNDATHRLIAIVPSRFHVDLCSTW